MSLPVLSLLAGVEESKRDGEIMKNQTFSGLPPFESKAKMSVVSRSLRPFSALNRFILQACAEHNR